MTSTSENDQNAYFELENALHTYPIVSAPANFSKSVMKNVRASVPKPQFRLSWFDYALTFFSTSMIGLVLFLWQLVPTQWIMIVRFQAFILWERSIRFPFTPILFVGFILVLIVMSFAMVLFRRPRLMVTLSEKNQPPA
jgi:hypothetical protein